MVRGSLLLLSAMVINLTLLTLMNNKPTQSHYLCCSCQGL